MSNIKIDLRPLFEKLENKQYCIIKLPSEFPEYKIGSDLDMFCYDIEDISRVVLGYLQHVITDVLTIKLSNRGKQIYIDIMDKDNIHFRFDLYGALPNYGNIAIKEAFFSSVIENSQRIEQNQCQVKVPSQIDESILRYIEYQEWYGQRPDKIKHVDYLEDKIKSHELNIDNLLDKLHYYTELPKVKNGRKVSSSSFIRYFNYVFDMVKRVLRVVQEKGLIETIDLIVKKLKK